MECPHITQGQTVSLTLKDLTSKIKGGVQCEVCGAKESVWICVTCGQLNCGRYVKAHALSHYEKASDGSGHPVCLECNELSVFCYACDDFIVNDTNDTKLDRMRGVLTKLQCSNGTNDISRSTLDGGNSSEVTVKIASDESSAGSPGNIDGRRSSRGNRRNRRSRSTDSDCTGVENQPENKKLRKEKLVQKQELRNLVGLRNLGNTCFMSAVLQSLGNIHEFCKVLKQLPSLDSEELLKSSGSLSSSSSSSPLSNSSNGSSKLSRETRNKNGFPADGPIMTEELRKVLVALNQGPQQGSNKLSNSSNTSNSSGNIDWSSSPSPSSTTLMRKVISPEALFLVIWKVVPRFRGYQQQDAHEFLRYMLDRLHTELLSLLPGDLVNNTSNNSSSNRLASNSPYYRQRQQRPMLIHRGVSGGAGNLSSSHSLVTQIFGGTLQSEVNCLVCNASSKKHDPFLDLSIDIPSTFLPYRKSKDKTEAGEKTEKQTCHLYDCLQKFVEVEELADSERFFCNNCKSKQRSTKKFWVRRLPNVLCLHIKRFRWSPYSRTKLDTHVAFPLKGLDMSSYLLSNLHDTRCSNSGSSLYDLAAVIVHHGSGAGSGHYTAFVVKNNNWYHFNDSTVLATEPETVAQSKAYILFYIQREFTAPKMS